MLILFRRLAALVIMIGLGVMVSACGGFVGGNAKANKPLSSGMIGQLKAIGSSPGEAMMVRIFKESSELEVWKRTASGPYRLLKTYEICSWSGDLGPKFREGDRQSPEGFYTVTPGHMHPNSNYYLAFNTGFPNKFDRAHGRTGTDLMVHGDCSSSGCYAMTDGGIAEIYALARESFKGGNKGVQLQIFPFRMTAANLAKHGQSPHMSFWNNIKDGHDRFELTKVPPTWDVCARQYVFDTNLSTPLDPLAACPAFKRDDALSVAVAAKQASDQAAVEQVELKGAKAAQEREVIKARGEAIGGFLGGIGGIFNGGRVNKAAEPSLVEPAG